MSGGAEMAMKYAYRLLAYRQRSVEELRGRLEAKGFAPEEAEGAIKRLKGLGYLDDEAFSRYLLRKASEVKLLGGSGALRYLRSMGISRQAAEEAVSGYDELASAERLVDKRLDRTRGGMDASSKRKLVGCLRRRGYSSETIRKVVGVIKQGTEGGKTCQGC